MFYDIFLVVDGLVIIYVWIRHSKGLFTAIEADSLNFLIW